MLRILYTNTDNSKRMSVVTDGIDNQMNIFATETPSGDLSYFASLGIVIESGKSYNLGTLEQAAKASGLTFLIFNEGSHDKLFSGKKYFFKTISPSTFIAPATGGNTVRCVWQQMEATYEQGTRVSTGLMPANIYKAQGAASVTKIQSPLPENNFTAIFDCVVAQKPANLEPGTPLALIFFLKQPKEVPLIIFKVDYLPEVIPPTIEYTDWEILTLRIEPIPPVVPASGGTCTIIVKGSQERYKITKIGDKEISREREFEENVTVNNSPGIWYGKDSGAGVDAGGDISYSANTTGNILSTIVEATYKGNQIVTQITVTQEA